MKALARTTIFLLSAWWSTAAAADPGAVQEVTFEGKPDRLEFTFTADQTIDGTLAEAIPAAGGEVLILRLGGISTRRRWVKMEDPLIKRVLLHPSKDRPPGAILRVRFNKAVINTELVRQIDAEYVKNDRTVRISLPRPGYTPPAPVAVPAEAEPVADPGADGADAPAAMAEGGEPSPAEGGTPPPGQPVAPDEGASPDDGMAPATPEGIEPMQLPPGVLGAPPEPETGGLEPGKAERPASSPEATPAVSPDAQSGAPGIIIAPGLLGTSPELSAEPPSDASPAPASAGLTPDGGPMATAGTPSPPSGDGMEPAPPAAGDASEPPEMVGVDASSPADMAGMIERTMPEGESEDEPIGISTALDIAPLEAPDGAPLETLVLPSGPPTDDVKAGFEGLTVRLRSGMQQREGIPRVAVLPLTATDASIDDQHLDEVATALVEARLRRRRGIVLVEPIRYRALLTGLAQESSGRFALDEARAMAATVGADTLLTGTVSTDGDGITVAARAMDVESGMDLGVTRQVFAADPLLMTGRAIRDHRSRADIIGRSALLPGWGQLHAGDTARGAGYLGAFAGAFTAGLASAIAGGLAEADYRENDPATVGRRADADAHYGRASALLLGATAVWLASLVDALVTAEPQTTFDTAAFEEGSL